VDLAGTTGRFRSTSRYRTVNIILFARTKRMDTDESEPKRVVTSAIAGMTVGEARRCLDHMRRMWSNANTEPFFITDVFPPDGMSIQTFALLFVKGQHQKRHKGPVQD